MEGKQKAHKSGEETLGVTEKKNCSAKGNSRGRAKRKRMKLVFVIELGLILVMGVVLFMVMSRTDTEGPKRVELVEEKLGQFDFLQVPHHGVWQTQLVSLLNMVLNFPSHSRQVAVFCRTPGLELSAVEVRKFLRIHYLRFLN